MDLKLECLAVSALADGVRHVELSRPEARNAMNHLFWGEMHQVFDALAEDPDCRVVVLSARGKSFSAGLDFSDPENLPPHADDPARKALKFIKHVRPMQECITAMERCLKPTIAVVHGACVGGGVDLITGADVRICSEDAFFCIREAAVGLAADMGTLARLPKIVGNDSVVRELALTARNCPASEALALGLVSRVLPTREEALHEAERVAGLIAANSPVAIVGTKRNLNFARDHSVQDSLEFVLAWNAGMIQTDDLMKAISAQLSKSIAKFSKL